MKNIMSIVKKAFDWYVEKYAECYGDRYKYRYIGY